VLGCTEIFSLVGYNEIFSLLLVQQLAEKIVDYLPGYLGGIYQ